MFSAQPIGVPIARRSSPNWKRLADLKKDAFGLPPQSDDFEEGRAGQGYVTILDVKAVVYSQYGSPDVLRLWQGARGSDKGGFR